jgi:hypothetical protein
MIANRELIKMGKTRLHIDVSRAGQKKSQKRIGKRMFGEKRRLFHHPLEIKILRMLRQNAAWALILIFRSQYA